MKKNHSVKAFMLVLAIMLFSNLLYAQTPVDKSKRPSPPVLVTGKIGDANISVDYSSPSVKGRKMLGGVLPYGKLWRAGANEATIFSTDKDITVEGQKLLAGKYSFFATPGEKKWTVFFNSETGQWGDKKNGDTNMDSTKTVLTFEVKRKKLDNLVERLEYKVADKGLELQWEYSGIFIRIKQ